MKTLNFKIEDDDLALLNYYRSTPEGGNTPQADFVKTAILEKCERTKHLRAGGFILEIPNPDNFNINDDAKIKVLQALRAADAVLAEINPALGLSEIITYYTDHFFKMSEIRRRSHSENSNKDFNFEVLGVEACETEGDKEG
ncbi:MAG: hypothetical protein M1130_12085 [Actinobacteria bacterium]|nr:hypothetical protein [Actinomycetota bacterium]